MITLSHSSNPIKYNNLVYRDKKTQKNLNNVWNQNVNVTKRASFHNIFYKYGRPFMLTAHV